LTRCLANKIQGAASLAVAYKEHTFFHSQNKNTSSQAIRLSLKLIYLLLLLNFSNTTF